MTDPEPGADERARRLLAGAPSPAMPPDVVARLDAVLADESRRRAERSRIKGGFGAAGPVSTAAPTSLVRTEPVLSDRPARLLLTEGTTASPGWRRPAAIALAAAVTAAAVGVAGYTLSATAGLNEPVAHSVLRVQSSDLAEQARAIAARRNLSAHVFSGAWRCARTVTDGRITGLAPAVVDGNESLLVYTRTRGEDWVTVVSGCPHPGALARESVRLGP